jgi:hypothetical protein
MAQELLSNDEDDLVDNGISSETTALKFLAYNVCCVIRSMHELGIAPNF